MKKRLQFTIVVAAWTVLPVVAASPAGRRPGPPPDPLGAGRSASSAVAAAMNHEIARRPGPPPDPLGEDRR